MNKNWITIVTKHHLITAVMVFASMLSTSYARAESNILFIIDASNSMHGQVGNESKIAAAKRVLGDLLKELPAETRVGLMAYGNSIPKDNEKACSDINILSPVGAESADAIVQKVSALQAKGQTPIAAALNMSAEAFKDIEGGNNHVVLISDGLETCGGDTCQAAKHLTEANINAKVHVVGFDVSAEEQTKLECISKMGNGKYFKAGNAEELKLAVAEVRKVAEAEVKPTEYTEVWRDDFDGDEVAEHWEIINPDLDAYIVEEGKLLILGTGLTYLKDEKASNLFRHTQELPKGDWRLTARVNMEFQTRSESFNLAAYDSHERFIAATPFIWMGQSGHRVGLFAEKYTKGKQQLFENKLIFKGKFKTAKIDIREVARKYPYLIRLEKKGRKYTASMKIEIDADEKVEGYEITRDWWKMKELTSLRPFKNAVFNFTLGSKSGKGESSVKVDYVMLESVVPGQEEAPAE